MDFPVLAANFDTCTSVTYKILHSN